jgi:outer membrane protein insertion porin family
MRTGRLLEIMLAVWLTASSAVRAQQEQPEGLVIGSIETAGTVTLTRAQVLSSVRARVGQVFRAEQAAEDVKRLASLEGVDTAYYNAAVADGKVVLTYVIVEKNLIRSIVLQGNKKVSDARLLSELGIKQGDYLDQFQVKSGVEKLKDYYRKKGYSQAQVALDESRLMVGQVIFTIEEGPRTRVKQVVFEGNQAFSDKLLLKEVKTRPRKFLVFPVYWDQEQLKKDEQKLLDFYRGQGYLDIKVDSSVSFSEDRKTAQISFRISEGPQYVVESLTLSGYLFEDEEALRSELKLKAQSPFNPDRLEYDIKKIRERYRSEGYLDVQVETVRKELEGHRVAVEHRISEGPRYRIGQITITGNQMFKDHSIRRVLDEEGFRPGAWYNGAAAQGDGKGELERIVQQSTAAQSVTIVPSGTEPQRRDALVQIAEGQTGTIMLGAGVASDSGLIGQISLDQRNFDITDWPTSFSDLITGKAFRGAGQRFRAMYSPGRRWTSYSVSFTEPYLYDQPLALDVGFYGFTRIRESYDEVRTGPSLGLTRRYSDGWRRGISFRFENVSVEELESDAPSDVVDVKGDNLRMGTRFWVGLDRTDSRFRPSKGYNFDAGYEQIFGDHTYGLLTATQRWYKTLYEDLAEHKTILEAKVFGGTVVGSAPTYDRFYGGGIGSIRGFRYRGISPRGENDDPIGSDWMAQGSLEVAIPLGSETFSWLVFGDAGLFESGPIRTSVGVGIQILIPQIFGPVPMRFELGAPITKDEEDDTQAFSFSVGALF